MIDQFSWGTASMVFTTYVIIDILYARYIIEVSRKRPFRAAVLSSVIYSLLAYGILQYSHNVLYVFPLICGAFIGTFLTVWFQNG